MMMGALGVSCPKHLYTKFEYELGLLQENHDNIYAALNAVRDAYHLREWVWHSWLEDDQNLAAIILGLDNASECDWNRYVNSHFVNFKLLRELCNGSKHLKAKSDDNVTDAYEGGWDSQPWDSPWDATGPYIILNDGNHLSVIQVLNEVGDFWRGFLKKYGSV